MTTLSGWIGTAVEDELSGPSVAAEAGLTVAFRGALQWRLDDPAILQEPEPARAVLRAYKAHGAKFLDRLFGSFALAVFDHGARSALLAIDRMGVERLAYANRDGGLVFSTSAETVARFQGASPRLRPQALLSFLYFHMIPSPETVFEGVRKIPPATALEWKNGTVREFVYWQPKFAAEGSRQSPELKEALHAALARGVRAANPGPKSGAFLSGGLDSSTVAGVLAKETAPRKARTFSIGFGFDEYDELKYARLANQRFGCDPTEYEVTPQDIVELIPRVAQAYDEPFGNASAIPTFCCARLALQNDVDHLLAGDGGDEIFGGNKRYAEQLVFERYEQVPSVVRSALLEPVLGSLPSWAAVSVLRKGRNYIAQAKTPLPDRFENWNFLHRLGFGNMLHPGFLAEVDKDGPLKHMRSVYQSAPPAGIIDKMLYYDWRFTLADNDLRKVGTMCELAGVRVSYPMLHQDVVDVSTQVPPDWKMRGTELRSFYKEAMADFLPHEIINKSKHGFGLPFGLWLQRSKDLAALTDDSLAGLQKRDIINPAFIQRLRSLHAAEDANYYGVFISTLTALEQWFRAHNVSP